MDFYVSKGYFPEGAARPPGDDLVPTPQISEAVVFRDFFTIGLRFACDKTLPRILERYSSKLHQLTLNSFVALSKFYWV